MDRVTRLPIKYALVFLILTEVLVWIGPIDYGIEKPWLLVSYLAILNYALYLGFVRGTKKPRYTFCSLSLKSAEMLLIIGLLCTLYSMYVKWSVRGFSLSFSHFLFALVNPGAAYNKQQVLTSASILYVLVGPFQWSAIPIGIFYWKRLPGFYRGLVYALFFLNVAMWLGIGIRKGIFDLLLVSVFLVMARTPGILNSKVIVRRLILLSIGLISLFLSFFVFSNLSRGGLEISEMQQYDRVEYKEVYARHLSTPIVVGLSEITSYLSGGYHLLSIGLNEGILPPTVMGMSFSTADYCMRFFGYDPLAHSYMQLIETKYGYDKYEYWHTFYLWMANDFTFVLVPIIVFLIGFFFARLWLDAIHGKNPFTYPLLAYFFVMVFYFFANNQVISFDLEPFVGCLLFYEISKSIKFKWY